MDSASLQHEEAGPDGTEKVGSSNTDFTAFVSKPVWPGRKKELSNLSSKHRYYREGNSYSIYGQS